MFYYRNKGKLSNTILHYTKHNYVHNVAIALVATYRAIFEW